MSSQMQLAKHIQKAINRTISKLATEQAKLIKQEFDIPMKKIRAMSRIKKASINRLNASILSLDTSVSLKHFKKSPVMQGKKVVGVNVKLNKGTKVQLKGHFIAKNKSTQGEFIAIGENSKHAQSPLFHYKASKKSYPSYQGSQKLYYPLSAKPFSIIAKEQSATLAPKIKEMFSKELEK